MKLTLRHVSKIYEETRAVDDVSLETMPDSGVLVLIGPSGGGKSTLLRLIGGLEPPTNGEIFHDGTLLPTDEIELQSFRRKNGFLFQNFNLFPHLSALDNLILPLTKVHGMEKSPAEDTARQVLARFDLEQHAEKMPVQLSGGQQQRVGLARAMAHQPGLLLLDEPTSALDPEMKAEVLDVIDELRQEGQKIILTTHEMGFAKNIGDEIVFLSRGKIVGSGKSAGLFQNPPSPEIEQFLARVMKW
ncbi:MAG: amino acid ABC transporter ATP-binding protein [Verrucomicrobiales bacterium]|nr:amino acid ABC transporter ATP-binding protein [Verrucomicrobiales bacterium]